AVPRASPILIRPADAERQVKVWIVRILFQRQLKQTPPQKPIKIETERPDAVELRELDLTPLNVNQAQVVEAEFAWQARLRMPPEAGKSTRDTRPFRKSATPELVVLGDRMKLGEVESDRTYCRYEIQWLI